MRRREVTVGIVRTGSNYRFQASLQKRMSNQSKISHEDARGTTNAIPVDLWDGGEGM
jgi:hypothetical protein